MKKNTGLKTSKKAFPKIALSLSGGGYRAASFHLGAFEMLNELELLDSVNTLSTVSGGTITGAAYALSLAKGESFDEFSKKFKGFLKTTNVIAEGLEKLPKTTEVNNSSAMPSLIRAASSVYAAKEIFGDERFKTILESSDVLENISFNSTDFRSGNSFRFQKSGSSRVYSGNKKAKISADVNEQIHIADIVAASSCFPSGFEPIRFPGDFVWSGNSLANINKILGDKFEKDIPLMDGGVFDNQGIDSLINIIERKNQKADLIIISDTDQRNSELLEFPPSKNVWGLKLKHINWLMYTIQVAFFITIMAILFNAFAGFRAESFDWLQGIFLHLIPFLFSLIVIFLASYIRSHAKLLQEKFNKKSGIKLWEYLKDLYIPQLFELAESRLSSLISMSALVFMKRIRDLGYKRLYSDKYIRDKIIANQIYDLDKKIDSNPEWEKFITKDELLPSKKLKAVVSEAEAYETNLWFLRDKDLENLISCGRATTCFNILEHLLEEHLKSLSNLKSPERILFDKTKKIWKGLK